MPKASASPAFKRQQIAKEFKNDSILDEGGSLICQACGLALGMTKFLVKQHIGSRKHKANADLKSKHQTLPAASQRKNEFSHELCEAFVAANIPVKKLQNPTLRNFLEKYMQRKIPDESTIRKNYLKDGYDDVIAKIRHDIGENLIFVSIDETTDKVGRYIANVIIGALKSDGPSRPHLIHLVHLEKTNAQTIAKTFTTALQILWPQGIQYDRVLLLVTDAAAYMKKFGKDLATLFPKMIHLTCLAHGLHRVADHIRCMFSKADALVNNVKKIFLKAPSRVQLLKEMYPNLPLPPQPVITRWGTWLDAVQYYVDHYEEIRDVIQHIEDDSLAITQALKLFRDDAVVGQVTQIGTHFSDISAAISTLQNTQRSMKDTLVTWNEIVRSISATPFPSVREKMNKIISKNRGLQIMELIDTNNISSLKKVPQFSNNVAPQQLLVYKFAPLASVDVERSFSLYKRILDDYRRNFTVENLRYHMLISFYTKFGQKEED